MNPAVELARLLGQKSSTQTVTVIESNLSTVRVSSRKGPIELKNHGSIYVQGDVLIVKDSVIMGRAVREDSVPVYYL